MIELNDILEYTSTIFILSIVTVFGFFKVQLLDYRLNQGLEVFFCRIKNFFDFSNIMALDKIDDIQPFLGVLVSFVLVKDIICNGICLIP